MTTTLHTPETLLDGPFGARLLIETGDFSLVEHPIAPAGFERYFAELAALLPPARPEPDLPALGALQERYRLQMDFGSIERLSREHGLESP